MTIIGIDLGTTNSLVAVMREGRPYCLANEFDEHLIPSAVAAANDGTMLVGRAAKDRLVTAPDAGRAYFKRDMGTPLTYGFGGRTWTPTECSALVLRELKRIAELRLQQPVDKAVITVPAYFHDSQRQATVEAAGIAGLTVERIMNEPTAAALAFGYRHLDEDRRILVFDLGGGTFDVTVLDIFSGIIEVKASGGDGRLGGEDWTDALWELATSQLAQPVPADQRGRLRQQLEVAKRALTFQLSTEVGIDGRQLRFTRTDFDRVTSPLVARLRPVVNRCLRDANLEPGDIAEVLLVGGASRMPAVQELVHGLLGKPGNRSLDPDRVVALGAAVQGALCAGDAAVADVVLTDVCPHTLGVEVAKQFSMNQSESGFFSPIIERNTTVPVSRSEVYSAGHPEQDSIVIKIFQGEARMTRDNVKLGTLNVVGVKPPLRSDGPGTVEIRFTYDMNGILEVEARVQHSGKRASLVIEQRPGALSPEQKAAALRAMRALKIHPRDALPNRARIERANRLYAELSGAARQVLTGMCDDFEAALASQNPEEIRQAAAILDGFLKQFYRAEAEAAPQPDPAGA